MAILKWGISSSGRALAWHARGGQFESDMLHSPRSTPAGIFYACHKTFTKVFWGDSFTNPTSRLIDRLHTYCRLNVVLMQTLRKIRLHTACKNYRKINLLCTEKG